MENLKIGVVKISIKKRLFVLILIVCFIFICISTSYALEGNGINVNNLDSDVNVNNLNTNVNNLNSDINDSDNNLSNDSNNLNNNSNNNNNNNLNIDSNNSNNQINSNNSLSNGTLTLEINKNKVITFSEYIKISPNLRKSKPNELSQNSIIRASKYVNWYIYKYGKLPNSVKIAKYRYSIPEFLYLISKTIQYKMLNSNKTVKPKYNLKDPQNIRGGDVIGSFSRKKYYSYVKNVLRYMNYYKVAPNLISTSGGLMQYQTIIFVFSKIVAEKMLPRTVDLDISNQNSLNKKIPKYVRPGTKNILNSKYNGGRKLYLLSSRNAQSNSEYIKTLAKKITKGHKTKLQKAKAIFYWVRDNVRYSFYFNTKYGAKKAIKNGRGNCVDQSHAIVALCRASKIPARYVNGNCEFISGKRYGHVWTQILVGKTWYVADASNFELNGFGVVNNWKVGTYRFKNIYRSTPF